MPGTERSLRIAQPAFVHSSASKPPDPRMSRIVWYCTTVGDAYLASRLSQTFDQGKMVRKKRFGTSTIYVLMKTLYFIMKADGKLQNSRTRPNIMLMQNTGASSEWPALSALHAGPLQLLPVLL